MQAVWSNIMMVFLNSLSESVIQDNDKAKQFGYGCPEAYGEKKFNPALQRSGSAALLTNSFFSYEAAFCLRFPPSLHVLLYHYSCRNKSASSKNSWSSWPIEIIAQFAPVWTITPTAANLQVRREAAMSSSTVSPVKVQRFIFFISPSSCHYGSYSSLFFFTCAREDRVATSVRQNQPNSHAKPGQLWIKRAPNPKICHTQLNTFF